MSYDLFISATPVVLNGLYITLTITLASFVIGQFLALPLGLACVSQRRFLRWPAQSFTFFERGSPLLVQLFLIYFGLAQIDSIRSSVFWPIFRDPIYAAILAIGLNSAAYSAEILKGALRTLPVGQYEAAASLGLSRFMVLYKVVLPQVYRSILPIIGNESISVLKATSIVSTITIIDMTGAARKFTAQTYAPFEVFIVTGVFYLMLATLFGRSFNVLERKLKRPSS